MVFKWKDGFGTKAKAEVVGAVCSKMEQEGRLSARNLVDDSTPVNAPLHSYFEWDDAVAADRYRIQQACCFISSLVVEDEETKEQEKCFYNIKTIGSNYYSTRTIKETQPFAKALENQAIEEMKAFRLRFNSIQKIQPVIRTIEEVLKEI